MRFPHHNQITCGREKGRSRTGQRKCFHFAKQKGSGDGGDVWLYLTEMYTLKMTKMVNVM